MQELGPSKDQWLSFFGILPQALLETVRTLANQSNYFASDESASQRYVLPSVYDVWTSFLEVIATVSIHYAKKNIQIIVPFQPTPTKTHPSRSPPPFRSSNLPLTHATRGTNIAIHLLR